MAKNRELERVGRETVRGDRARLMAHEVVTELLAALLPHIDLLRDSREVLASKLTNRGPALRLLRELSHGDKQGNASPVKSAPGWWEQHFNADERDNGRMYFRYRGNRCSVLVSFKARQEEDIGFLQDA